MHVCTYARLHAYQWAKLDWGNCSAVLECQSAETRARLGVCVGFVTQSRQDDIAFTSAGAAVVGGEVLFADMSGIRLQVICYYCCSYCQQGS